MKIYNFEQGSRDWFIFRAGSPLLETFPKITASCFKAIVTSTGKPAKPSRRNAYLETLASEYITGELNDQFVSIAMQEGRVMEAEARKCYEFENDCEVTEVGCCLDDTGHFSYSPDGLVGTDGLLEIKCVNTDKQEKTIKQGKLPSEHVQQCQGGLWITGRKWLDFYSYHNVQAWEGARIAPFQFRVYPDAEYHMRLERELRAAQIILSAKIKEKENKNDD